MALIVLALVGAAPAPAIASDPSVGSAERDPLAIHSVPTLPLTIDGTRVAGEAILAFNGRILHMAFIPDSDGASGRLHAFTSPVAFEDFVYAHGGPERVLAKPSKNADPAKPGVGWRPVDPRDSGGVSTQAWDTTGIIISEHMDYGGCGLFLEKGWGYSNLPGVYGCMWPNNWNDETSSVRTSPYRTTYALLFDHINYGGSSLYIAAGGFNSYLEGIGWNDRVSSFQSL